jgi:UDP-3-O-[3-hydroxymyristoyl] glucosamine N-acyltransferase
VIIGADCILHPRVVVQDRCELGQRVILHPGAVIGADGFGYLPPISRDSGLIKIPHLGNVVLEDDVEVGANSAIDRSKFGSTRIGAGTKIDNLCQIGHGCQIGRHCIICGGCGIAGSVVIEDGATLAGGVGVSDNCRIGAGARLAGHAAVSRDVPPGESWGGSPALLGRKWLRGQVLLARLPDMLPHLLRDAPNRPQGPSPLSARAPRSPNAHDTGTREG